MTVWQDLQEQAELLKKRRCWKPVRVLGIDGTYPLLKGKEPAVPVAVDLGDGQPVAIGQVDEANPQALRRFLEPLIKRLGASVIVSDDLISFRQVAEKLDVEHQVCQFHVRRWVGRVLHELRERVPKDWLCVLEEIQELLAELPPEGSRRLFHLWKQIPERRTGQAGERSPLERLRHLLIRLSEHWESYRMFVWQKDVPWTNNATLGLSSDRRESIETKQVIGRMAMRARTARGYKSWQGMRAAFLLTGTGISY